MPGLAEIAAAAGVSISTVSRVLNRRAGVNEETRRRVLKVLAERPYAPRGLGALQRTGVLGLLVPGAVQPGLPRVRRGAGDAGGRPRLLQRAVQHALGHHAGGGVRPDAAGPRRRGHGLRLPRGDRHRRVARPLPAAQGRGRAHGLRQRRDAVAGGAGRRRGRAGRRLPGHPAPGWSSGTGGSASSVGPTRSMPSPAQGGRLGGRAGGGRARHCPELVATRRTGRRAGPRRWPGCWTAARPTAVICSSDLMALGAISEAQHRGLQVPRDLSVVGFDDIPLAAYCTPALTTLAQPIPEIAAAAVDGLLADWRATRRRRTPASSAPASSSATPPHPRRRLRHPRPSDGTRPLTPARLTAYAPSLAARARERGPSLGEAGGARAVTGDAGRTGDPADTRGRRPSPGGARRHSGARPEGRGGRVGAGSGGAAAAGDVGEGDGGGDAGVERLGVRGHRDRHPQVAGLADQPGQPAALGADHQQQRVDRRLQVVQRARRRRRPARPPPARPAGPP